jgi:hypothetical protein
MNIFNYFPVVFNDGIFTKRTSLWQVSLVLLNPYHFSNGSGAGYSKVNNHFQVESIVLQRW